jgi:tetratricopeptide (TPR) repeat protein
MTNVSKDSNSKVNPLDDPDSDAYKALVACVDIILRDPDGEIAKCTENIRLHPDDAMTYICRGLVYESMNNFDMAIADYSAAIRLGPDKVLYYSRGDMYLRNGDLDKAIVDYTEAIRLNANFAEAYLNRGLAYEKNGDTDSAIADYTEALRIDPNREDAQKALAAINVIKI